MKSSSLICLQSAYYSCQIKKKKALAECELLIAISCIAKLGLYYASCAV